MATDPQLEDVREALRLLDEVGVPSVVDGHELTIAERVRVLCAWAGKRRRGGRR